MQFFLAVGVFVVISCSNCVAQDIAKLRSLIPNISGIATAKVTADQIHKESDDFSFHELSVQVVRSTGYISEHPRINGRGGGCPLSIPPDDPPQTVSPLRYPKEMQIPEVGNTYWFVFASSKHGHWLDQIFEIDDQKVAAIFESAIMTDTLQWQPIYSDDLKLVVGHIVLSENQWQIRVTHEGTELWTTKIQGSPFNKGLGSFFWGTVGYSVEYPWQIPKSQQLLEVETRVKLDQENRYGLPTDVYCISNVFDLMTGDCLSEAVYTEVNHSLEVAHEYKPATHERIRVERFTLEIDSESVRRLIRTSTNLNPSNGEVISTTRYYNGPVPTGGNGWIKLENEKDGSAVSNERPKAR